MGEAAAVTDLLVLVPVLDRPQRASRLAESLRDATLAPHRLLFLCSPGDDAQRDSCLSTGAEVVTVDWQPGPGDYARKINLGFLLGDEEWVFTGADDLDFHPAWDIEAFAAAERHGACVVGTNDLGNPQTRTGRHSTHSLVRRAYIDEHGGTFDHQPGVVFYEGYDHQYVDTELVQVARDHRCFIACPKSVVEHLHPLWKKDVERDATYEKALARGQQDSVIFRERARRG